MPLLDKLREQYGVGPLCSELHIAPSTYYHCQQQRHHPDKRSARAQRDDWLKKEIQRVYDVNRPGFPGECFICELRLPDHRF
ncbi:IS629 transposase OrfB [Escherichia coli O145:H28]|nr:IS629 transposase OrfB [Escherichia coli O145:H28]GEI30506.1 IS629 transposase OrfB [Escherichia coli O145:H28]